MPLMTITCIGPAPKRAAQHLADRLGPLWACAPGRLWVRVVRTDAADYAENGVILAPDEWPVFVQVLHREPPTGAALEAEVTALTQTVAEVLGRPAERVHVGYEPGGAGRQAFGGALIA